MTLRFTPSYWALATESVQVRREMAHCTVVLQRLEVLDEVLLLGLAEMEAKSLVVAVHDVEQRGEPTVMIEAPLVFRTHEQAALADENAGQVHRPVAVVRRAVGLEAVDPELVGLVDVPARLGPQRLVMAAIAVGLPAEQ